MSCTSTSLIVESNGIPSYEFVAITPNDLAAQNHRYVVPLDPELPERASDIPLLGTAGFAVNGLPIYGPNEGPFPDPYGDPIYNDIMDECQGHTARAGDYHYHALLVACLTRDTAANQASPVIGYASDGFPIYGPRGCIDASCSQVVTFVSSWEQVADPTTYAWDAYQYREKSGAQYLDECNGRIGPDGSYRYHATSGFPYVLGCYAGLDIVKDSAGGGGTDDPGSGDATVEPDDGDPEGGEGGGATAATGTVSFAYEGALSGEGLGAVEVELVRAQSSSGVLQATSQSATAGHDMDESMISPWGDGYLLTVFDLATGECYQYNNPVGRLSAAIASVDALQEACGI